MVAQDGAFIKGQAEFAAILGWLQGDSEQGRPLGEVEKELHEDLQKLGLGLLRQYVAAQGTGDLGPALAYQGRELRRLKGLHKRPLVTVFGKLVIRRTVYGMRETQKQEVVPLDARLKLPEGEFSYLLQDWAQSFCVQGSYEQSRDTLERILGFRMTVRSLEHMNLAMAEAVPSFLESQPAPPKEEEGSILVVTADGKGVPMRREADEKPSGDRKRRSSGEKANKKREACVGAVYTIDPFVRSPQDVVNDLFRKQRSADRPKPRHKRLRAELSRPINGQEVKGKELTFQWLAEQVKQRRAPEQDIACLMDGDRGLRGRQEELLPQVTLILDLCHATDRVWEAAHCFHPEGSQEASDFVMQRLLRLLEGHAGRVIGGFRQMATKRALRESRRAQLQKAVGYLEANRPYMKYDEYLAKGYPIASGVVEGACRHLVKDRMEQTGMRWTVSGAQAMLNLRAMRLNDDWEAFQHHRMSEEQRALYTYRDFIERAWKAAA